MRFLSALSAAALVATMAVAQGAIIEKAPADSSTLSPLPMTIGGRVLPQPDAANPAFGSQVYIYQWPGTYFETTFKGTEAYFRIVQGEQTLHVVVDDASDTTLAKPEPGTYRISQLPYGRHTVRIEVATESQSGPNTFGGFAQPHQRARQIEFIGDSHTVGYGNTFPGRECSRPDVWQSTDVSQAFASLTAKHYRADYQVNAISGRGIVRNYDGFAADTMPVAYPFVLFDKKNRYQDTAWQPEVVVLSLGTNDFSTALHPGERWKTRDELHADYEATYVQFLRTLRGRYPDAFFIVWATDAVSGEIAQESRNVVNQINAAGDAKVALLPITGLKMNGCDSHPSTADDNIIAGKLIELINSRVETWRDK